MRVQGFECGGVGWVRVKCKAWWGEERGKDRVVVDVSIGVFRGRRRGPRLLRLDECKAKAEGRKCSDYLCYEAERAAACMTLCLPHTLVKVRAGLRAWEVARWACTIAITCSEFHKRRGKSRRLGWVACTDGLVNILERACGACGRASGRWSVCDLFA